VHHLYIVLIGLTTGLFAKLLTPGSGRTGLLLTTVLGVCGALLANYVGQWMGLFAASQSTHLIGAVVGSVVLLAIYFLGIKR
jgi:uncharacterized membrane protein YeaQ/YmgE (transglycosylase-associated protein family)